jgi:hypothetical protein
MADVKSFKCKCGAPLELKPGVRIVKCDRCGTDNVIEGLQKNTQMAEKENINSGYMLSATPERLHSNMLDALYNASCVPTDILTDGEIIAEEHHYVPSYLYYCNASAAFTYEVGVERTQYVPVTSGGGKNSSVHTTVKAITNIEYTPMSGQANITCTVLAPGNRQLADPVNKMYARNFDTNKLVDYDEMTPSFTATMTTHEFNIPKNTAFSEYIKPSTDALLQADAQRTLQGKNVRNVSMSGGSRIDKEEPTRVFMGLYKLLLRYKGKDYSLWNSSDADRWLYETAMPVDEQKKRNIAAKQQEMEQAVAAVPPPKTLPYTLGKIGSIVLFAILLFAASGLAILWIALGITGFVVFNMLGGKVTKQYNEYVESIRSGYQAQIDAIESETRRAIDAFRQQNKRMRGVYYKAT